MDEVVVPTTVTPKPGEKRIYWMSCLECGWHLPPETFARARCMCGAWRRLWGGTEEEYRIWKENQ